jgi:hypothetical protein
MSDEIQKNILTEIRARHEQDQRWRNGPSMIRPQAHDDRGWLLTEIERLRARVEVLEDLARKSLHALTFDQNGPHRNALRAALEGKT